MAEFNSSENVMLSQARLDVCLSATWEIDALARILPEQVPNTGDTANARLVIRGIAGRLLRLTSVLMSGLGEEEELFTMDKVAGILMTSPGEGQG